MNTTIIQIEIAIMMAVVGIGMLIWLQSDLTAASVGRMMRMIVRVGVDPKIVARDDRQTVNLMKDVRERCARCPSEGRCEQWLAGEIGGANTFCPNARVFDELVRTGELAA